MSIYFSLLYFAHFRSNNISGFLQAQIQGSIGSRVAEIGEAFGMKILVNSRTKKDLSNYLFLQAQQKEHQLPLRRFHHYSTLLQAHFHPQQQTQGT